MRGRNKLAPAAEPNVIPFIDVMLVLLIIFMVTAPTPTVDLHVELPHGASVPTTQPTLVSIVDAGGSFTVAVDGEAVSLEQLGTRTLAHAIADNPGMPIVNILADARVFVRADQNTAYGNVVSVMDRLHHAHFAKVGIFAEEADG